MVVTSGGPCHWKKVFLVFPKRRGLAPQAGPRVEHPEAQGAEAAVWWGPSLYCVFFRKGKAGPSL